VEGGVAPCLCGTVPALWNQPAVVGVGLRVGGAHRAHQCLWSQPAQWRMTRLHVV